MPPKAKITREMVESAAVEIIRRSGAENLNARAVAEELNCSTQPVMYHFATMEELKRAAYARIDRIHTDALLAPAGDRDPLLSIGLNYIRFAVEEPNLFRFLFQSGYAPGTDLDSLIGSDESGRILEAMREGIGCGMERTKEIFLTVALFAHGYASIIANNRLNFDEDVIAGHLEKAFNGAVLAAREEE
ncbi:MAG: TetR/AcrR family transcriptional regulator [Ruminococcaceae bacterium]|nr:TetR/AcrR family transcriptional regulator [Oscillospiraceae bacterium]